jgi:hypothetical protein
MRDVLTGRRVDVHGNLAVATVFSAMPHAMLVSAPMA